MSALIGQRSGNRGRCAQPCRLPYGVNSEAKNTYPLSLKDANLSAHLQEMVDMGVACLKLEGRMKRSEYVAEVTDIYRRLVDEGRKPNRQEQQQLHDAFSRSGFTDWYYQGKKGAGMFGTRPENTPEPKELFAAAKASYEKEDRRTVGVSMHCSVRADEAATLTASAAGETVTVTGAVPEAARNRALTEDELQVRLGKTGGTAFTAQEITVALDDGLMLSAGAVNAMRRDALEQLTQKLERRGTESRRTFDAAPLPPAEENREELRFTCSIAKAEQLSEALVDCAPEWVYIPLELLDKVELAPYADRTKFCAVLPRVWRDRDEAELKEMISHAKSIGVTAALLGNIGHLSLMRDSGLALYGDYGLNVFNARSMDYLRSKDLASACVSFELRFAQIRDMQKILPAEAIVYGRLPLMITENCLTQNAMGCREDRCGTCVPEHGPCRKVHTLQDRTGAAFPLLGVYGHRTEVQNSRVLWLADRPDWKHLGLAYARLRFTTETPDECAAVLKAYAQGASAPGEFTRGLYERGVE
jgi:putative protease